MVDPVSGSGIGPLQNVSKTSQATQRDKAQREDAKSVVDEVSISEEAISLQQAEEKAAESRRLLENSAKTLGLPEDFE